MTTQSDHNDIDYGALHERHAALTREAMPLNKTALFDALRAAGVSLITVAFDGAGDSGQIDSIAAFNADNTEIELPPASLKLHHANRTASGLDTADVYLRDAIETLCYDCLEETHRGWEIADGAFGEFKFDVAARTVALHYNERWTEVDTSSHIF